MDRRSVITKPNTRIRPVVYAAGFYFLIAATDSFRIGAIGSLLKIVAFLPLCFLLFDINKLRIRFSAILVLQLMFWLLSAASIFFSIDADRTFSSFASLTLNLLLVVCLGAMEQYSEAEFDFLIKSLLLGGWVTVLLMLLFSGFSDNGRITLLLGQENKDQNYINGYFLFAFSYHTHRMLVQKSRNHIFPTVFLIVVVLLTGSRGALLAFFVTMFTHICVLFGKSEHRMRNIVILAVVILLVLLTMNAVLAYMPESVSERFSWTYITEKGLTGRTRIWRFLLNHYADDSIPRMLFGHGYGTTSLINTMNGRVAHNLYIDNLMTLGLVGVLLQVATQTSVVFILLKQKQYPLLGAYMGMICMCMSLSLVAYKPIWNIMLLTLALGATKRKEYEIKESCD